MRMVEVGVLPKGKWSSFAPSKKWKLTVNQQITNPKCALQLEYQGQFWKGQNGDISNDLISNIKEPSMPTLNTSDIIAFVNWHNRQWSVIFNLTDTNS